MKLLRHVLSVAWRKFPMTEQTVIPAAPRNVVGKKVSQLRRQGILPGNVYGRGLESTAVQLDAREFTRAARTGRVRGMFQLAVEGEASPRYVILRGITRKGGTGDPIHADFFQVDLQRPLNTTVALRLIGESPAVRDLAGTLVQNLETVNIRCLPLDIPERLEADLGILKNYSASLTVADLTVPSGVEITTDRTIVIASVTPPRIRRGDVGGPADGAEEGEAEAGEEAAPEESGEEAAEA
jgi:large subunit ribosomal protein L25